MQPFSSFKISVFLHILLKLKLLSTCFPLYSAFGSLRTYAYRWPWYQQPIYFVKACTFRPPPQKKNACRVSTASSIQRSVTLNSDHNVRRRARADPLERADHAKQIGGRRLNHLSLNSLSEVPWSSRGPVPSRKSGRKTTPKSARVA